MSASNAQNFLYRDCGLKGLSGISNDMRELETSEDPNAKLAVEYFVYRIGLNAGMLAAALQGLDAFVFTAGIGENSARIRARIADQLALAWCNARRGREFPPRAPDIAFRQPCSGLCHPDR